MKIPSFSLIAAKSKENGIGFNNNLPWRKTPIKVDLNFFKIITTNTFPCFSDDVFKLQIIDKSSSNVIIMGRKTWESLPETIKPPKGVVTIVVTSNKLYVAYKI